MHEARRATKPDRGGHDARRRRLLPLHGFTLVELLVVISIVGTLMSLMLVALQSARESGRRTRCNDNLLRLSLAARSFAEQSGFLPGWRHRYPRSDWWANTLNVSWTVPLLPFMQRNDLYQNWLTVGNNDNAEPYLSFFVCPTSEADNTFLPTLSYGGNAGSGSNAVGPAGAPGGTKWDGIMVDTTVAAARISPDDVGDGMAATILLSERCGPGKTTPPPAVAMIQAFWCTDVVAAAPSPFFTNATTAIPVFGISATPPADGKVVNSGSTTAPFFWSLPSSRHPGGVVAAFCDGRTAFVRDTIAPGVYAQLLSSNEALASAISRTTWGGTVPVTKDSYR